MRMISEQGILRMGVSAEEWQSLKRESADGEVQRDIVVQFTHEEQNKFGSCHNTHSWHMSLLLQNFCQS